MASLLSEITLQPQVRDLLQSMVSAQRVTHAYLFSGPKGCGKLDAAYAFAQAILCENEGCGSCIDCKKVQIRKHPDVHVVQPEGAAGYLIEQIRMVVADANRAPIQARKKVYILDAAETFGTAAANAFLKTLEEPTGHAVLILLTSSEASVLPTILSRCQVVRFRSVPANELACEVARRSGASEETAGVAVALCDGSLELAQEYCQNEELQEVRQRFLELLAKLESYDDWDLLKAANELMQGGESLIDQLKQQQEEELELASDFLQKGALKQMEARNKRQITAKTRQLFRVRCSGVESWLRDVLLVRAGRAELVVNKDAAESIRAAAARVDEQRLLCACDAVSRCVNAIDYNVTLQLCMNTLLLEIREDLYGPDYPGKTYL